MENNETTITKYCKDEIYCDWYKCKKCGEHHILNNANYCPNCGKKIIKRFKK